MAFIAIHENKFLGKISEFTVVDWLATFNDHLYSLAPDIIFQSIAIDEGTTIFNR